MAKAPSPPITVYENGDVTVYPDVESACGHLEVYDLDELWLADRFGHTLIAKTRGYTVTDLVVDESVDPAPGELANRLRAFIASVGRERVGMEDLDYLPVDQLLDSLLVFFAKSRGRRTRGSEFGRCLRCRPDA